MVAAKGETTRIEIAHGKRPFVTLTGPATAGQFTIWSGPGTSAGPRRRARSDDHRRPATSPTGRAVRSSRRTKLAVFKVRFFCAAEQDPQPEVAPSHQCYGVRYAIDPETQQGYIQIPPERDQDFPHNTQSIYRGVEGQLVPCLGALGRAGAAADRCGPAGHAGTTTAYYQQPYIYTPPAAHTAVSAKSLVIPKK